MECCGMFRTGLFYALAAFAEIGGCYAVWMVVRRGVSTGWLGVAAVAEARALPDSELPEVPGHREGPKASPALVSLLKVLLAAKCEQFHVAPKLVANSEDIDRLATEEVPDVACTTGWRADVFGADAMALKSGKLALGVDGKRVKLIRN